MASAADIRHSTESGSASLSKTGGQTTPANPRLNAVACEVHIIATGARPSENAVQRELFTEETTTALVFENGGVLRLSAKVAPGQLLFLTHKETKREVVAQVTRKRDFRPGICYVEVEFSEPSPGFWSIAFPPKPALDQANVCQKEADDSAQMEQAIMADEPTVRAAAPSAQEVTALKIEVEVLREQLKLLQTQPVAGNSDAPSAIPGLPPRPAFEPPRAPFADSVEAVLTAQPSGEPSPRLQSPTGEPPQPLPTEVSGTLANAVMALTPTNTSLPTDGAEATFSEEHLTPKPGLALREPTPQAKLASKPQEKVVANSQPAALRKDLLFAAFVLVTAGAMWYQNLLPWLPQPKKLFSSPAPSFAPRPIAHAPQKTANSHADSTNSSQTRETPASSTAALRDASQPESAATAKPSALAPPETSESAKSSPDKASFPSDVGEKPEVDAPTGKRATTVESSKPAVDSDVPPPSEKGIVPPKLVKSVLAVASPNALPEFATGKVDNVTLDALVDTSGHVRSMKPLSGSAALRSAAMEALKQYIYKPATLHGKPVPAHVIVKVKFLFEP